MVKAAVRNFFVLKTIQNKFLSKYLTSQCSKLSACLSLIQNGKLVLNSSGTGGFTLEIRVRMLEVEIYSLFSQH